MQHAYIITYHVAVEKKLMVVMVRFISKLTDTKKNGI